MQFKYTGNKGDTALVVIKNNDPNSTVVLQGAPVHFIADAVTAAKGRDVKAQDGRAGAETGFFAGFNISGSLNIGDQGQAFAYGFYDYARVLLSTRATTTDVWASYSAIALGDIMKFITTSGVQAVQRSGAGSDTNAPWFVLAAATLVSQTTQASSVANGIGNSTAMVTTLRVHVRAL
jgi:hypothetical protein